MAKLTPTLWRKQVIYSIFVRNFTEEGTFLAVIPELDRIKQLGVDTIWFMPIHPLGEKNRKGQAGSPYAIKDYRAINPEFGTLEDFIRICDEIHQRGMKVMIDVVYNHTAPDSVLVKEHPEWFYRKANGEMGNQVGDWTDIVDLDYRHRELWDYQIETLCYWAQYVDGFRCDVAPFVPVEFWLKARQAVEKVKPDVIWLSESVHLEFIREMRAQNVMVHSDCEIYQAFDMTYEYDVRDIFEAYIKGERSLNDYVERLNLQDVIYPANYIKLRNLENHDNVRIKHLVPEETQLLQWTAFMYLQRGATLLYNGQEVQATHTPTLFDKDTIDWHSGRDISDYLTKLAEIKHECVSVNAPYYVTAHNELDTVVVTYREEDAMLVGVCSLKGKKGLVSVPVADGEYRNLLNNTSVKVENGEVLIGDDALIFQAKLK